MGCESDANVPSNFSKGCFFSMCFSIVATFCVLKWVCLVPRHEEREAKIH